MERSGTRPDGSAVRLACGVCKRSGLASRLSRIDELSGGVSCQSLTGWCRRRRGRVAGLWARSIEAVGDRVFETQGGALADGGIPGRCSMAFSSGLQEG